MSLTLFEDLMAEQVALMPAVVINANVSRVPSFGWGDSDDLRKFLAYHQEKHNPLIWSVPRPSTPSGTPGLFTRTAELNFCVIEDKSELLNEVRLQPGRSFKKVLLPMWEQFRRRLDLSDMTMREDEPGVQLFPNYKLGDEHEAQFIWDVMKLTFTVNYSLGYTPCHN